MVLALIVAMVLAEMFWNLQGRILNPESECSRLARQVNELNVEYENGDVTLEEAQRRGMPLLEAGVEADCEMVSEATGQPVSLRTIPSLDLCESGQLLLGLAVLDFDNAVMTGSPARMDEAEAAMRRAYMSLNVRQCSGFEDPTPCLVEERLFDAVQVSVDRDPRNNEGDVERLTRARLALAATGCGG